MPVSAFEHPFLSGLLGDPELAVHFAAEADIAAMLVFEAALADAEAAEAVIPADAAAAIAACCAHFQPDMEALHEGTARDGVVVPDLVRQLRAAVGTDHGHHVHVGATSQDVIDTSLVLRLKPAIALLRERIGTLLATLDELDQTFGRNALMARTRMQAAKPIRVGDRLARWAAPLERLLGEADAVEVAALRLQFSGAVGTLDDLGASAGAVAARLGLLLGLEVSEVSWHSDRGGLVRLAGWLSELTGALGKIGQDIALMAQNGIDAVAVGGAGGSSAMAHKKNPVKAEVLVALARFNAVQVGAMHQALVHEQERSGAAWTLEWMVLPQMALAAGSALLNAQALLDSVQALGQAIGQAPGQAMGDPAVS